MTVKLCFPPHTYNNVYYYFIFRSQHTHRTTVVVVVVVPPASVARLWFIKLMRVNCSTVFSPCSGGVIITAREIVDRVRGG